VAAIAFPDAAIASSTVVWGVWGAIARQKISLNYNQTSISLKIIHEI
jgi:hypothetical protein